MTDEHRAIQLKQLANIVIDAYIRRDERFKPDFDGANAIMFLSRPEGDKDHPGLELGHWYEADDFKDGNQG